MPDGSAVRGMITRETETAIERGLAYLARDQQPDGSFGFGNYRSNVAVTSLAGMAFMAGGHFPGPGAYGRQVARALEFVLAQAYRQERFGIAHPLGFLYNPDGTHHGPMYGHGFGTLFLGELYGMVSDPTLRSRLKEVLPLAVQVILKAQNHEGGWRYFPQPPDYADISVTICQIMALLGTQCRFLRPQVPGGPMRDLRQELLSGKWDICLPEEQPHQFSAEQSTLCTYGRRGLCPVQRRHLPE